MDINKELVFLENYKDKTINQVIELLNAEEKAKNGVIYKKELEEFYLHKFYEVKLGGRNLYIQILSKNEKELTLTFDEVSIGFGITSLSNNKRLKGTLRKNISCGVVFMSSTLKNGKLRKITEEEYKSVLNSIENLIKNLNEYERYIEQI